MAGRRNSVIRQFDSKDREAISKRPSSVERGRTRNKNGSPKTFENSSRAEEGRGSTSASTRTRPGKFLDLEDFLKTVARVRFFWWWVLGALFIALPFVLAASIFRYVRIGPIGMVGLFVWLELSWLTLWTLYFITWCIGMAWRWLCQLEPLGIFDYQDFLDDLKWSLTLLLWAIVSWAIVPALCVFDHEDCIVGWILIFQSVLIGMLVSTVILFAKCFVVELVFVKATVSFLSPRRQALRKSASAIVLLLRNLEMEKSREATKRSVFKSIHKLVMHPALHDSEKYLQGKGDKDSYSAIRKQILNSFGRDSRLEHSLTKAEIENRLNEHKCEANGQRHKDQRKFTFESIDELMKSLGAGGKKKVSDEDLTWLITDIGVGLETVRKGEECIKKVVGHLDAILTLLVLVAIALVFAAFFISNLSNYLTPFWTTFTGLGFALSGTVQEYLAACTFVFSQHPYDIGDRVALTDDKLLIVEDIHLAYTTFLSVENGRVRQIRHSVLCKETIENLSRSNIQRDRDSFYIESSISDDELEKIKGHLHGYVRTAQKIRINRYFDHFIRIVPSKDSEDDLEIRKLCVDILCKPRIGAAYEVLLLECRQMLWKELHSKLSEHIDHRDSMGEEEGEDEKGVVMEMGLEMEVEGEGKGEGEKKTGREDGEGKGGEGEEGEVEKEGERGQGEEGQVEEGQVEEVQGEEGQGEEGQGGEGEEGEE